MVAFDHQRSMNKAMSAKHKERPTPRTSEKSRPIQDPVRNGAQDGNRKGVGTSRTVAGNEPQVNRPHPGPASKTVNSDEQRRVANTHGLEEPAA